LIVDRPGGQVGECPLILAFSPKWEKEYLFIFYFLFAKYCSVSYNLGAMQTVV
jgi:hypothetical protein